MKKAFYLILTVLALASVGVSCVHPLEPWEKIQPEPEPEPEPQPEPEPEPGPDPTPTPPGPAPEPQPEPVTSLLSAAFSFSEASFPLKRLELSGDGRYVAEVRIATKGADDIEVVFSTYGVSGTDILLKDLGTVAIVLFNGKATGTFQFPDGRSFTTEGSIQWPSASTSGAVELFKTWPITKTRISVSEGIKINADLNGCDLGELAKLLEGLGVKVGDSLTGVKIETVEFTWGSMILHCSNGHNYEAYCNYDGYEGTRTFGFSLSDFLSGFSGGDGKATVKFSSGVCMLTLEMSFARGDKNYKGSITFVLKA